MPTLARARHIQRHMGGSIYWDKVYFCYRVMRCGSPSLYRWYEHYEKVE